METTTFAGDLLTEGEATDGGGTLTEYFDQKTRAKWYVGAMIALIVLLIVLLNVLEATGMSKPKSGFCNDIIDEKHLANCLYYQQPYAKLGQGQ